MDPDADAGRWNHNIHYQPLLLAAMPAGARRALDAGCGEGVLARRLARTVPRVVAIDRDQASIAAARSRDHAGRIDYRVGDFLTEPFESGSFDFVVCVAALHHVDEAAALARLGELVAPGGALAVLGLARARYPVDLWREVAGFVVHRAHRMRRGGLWHSPAPIVLPPPQTHREVELLAARLLPGSRFQRHLLWRYSIIWRRPAE